MEKNIYHIENIDNFEILIPEDKKVVFTNGCFDILHIGHIELLKFCRTKGNFLVVGLNSDRSVKILKGSKRPILDIRTRSTILSSLVFVDLVVIFDDETPYKLISKLIPDILIKGGDYRPEEIVGSNIAGETLIFPIVDNAGTTDIIKIITGRYCTRRIDEIIQSSDT